MTPSASIRARRLAFIALLAPVLAACGPDSILRLDSFGTWCDGAPCGWTLRRGTIQKEREGARLGGPATSVLAVDAPIPVDAGSPGYLVVLTQGTSLVTLRWDVDEDPEDDLYLSFVEPTYLYFALDPPRAATRFTVTLATGAGASAYFRLVGVTRCAPIGNPQAAFGTWWSTESPRVRSWYWIEARFHEDGLGSECD